jgi:uncharacterized membrane protein
VERRVRSRLLHVLSLICLGLGLAMVLMVDTPTGTTPFFNSRFGCYAAAIAALAAVIVQALRAHRAEEPEAALPWLTLAGTAGLIINLLILIGVSFEIDSFWWRRQWSGQSELLHSWEMYAQFTYSAFFMLFGALLLALGFWRRMAFLRWQALVLLAATIGKVFLWDMSALSQGYRILSFLGLGALLLGVSFVYQRDWLHLRADREASGESR